MLSPSTAVSIHSPGSQVFLPAPVTSSSSKNDNQETALASASSPSTAPLTLHRTASSSVSQRRFVLKRINRAMEIFSDLLDTTKGKASLQPGEEWAVYQLRNMKNGNHITQMAKEFITNYQPQSDTRYCGSALAGDTATKAREIKQDMKEAGLDRIAVLGLKGREVDEPRNTQQLDLARFVVLPEGDFHTVYQFLDSLKYLLSGQESTEKSDEKSTQAVSGGQPKTLVIADSDFYAPLLSHLFGNAPPGEESAFYERSLNRILKEGESAHFPYNIRVLHKSDNIAEACHNELQASQEEVPAGRVSLEAQLFPERTNIPRLFVGSTKGRKIQDLRDALAKDAAEIKSLMELIDELGEPKEGLKSYGGNARGVPEKDNSGKAESFIRTIKKVLRGELPTLSKNTFLHRAKKLGVDVDKGDKLIFIADDRGFEFPDWKKIAPYFPADLKREILEEIEEKVGRSQNLDLEAVPGVETTWWVNKLGGTKAAMGYFMRAFEQYNADHPEAPLEPKVTSVCVLAVTEMDLNTGEPAARKDYEGSTTFDFRRPGKESGGDDSEAWYVSNGNNPEGKSVQELIEHTPDGKFAENLPWIKASFAMRSDGYTFENSGQKKLVRDYRIRCTEVDGSRLGQKWESHIRQHARKRLTRHVERAALSTVHRMRAGIKSFTRMAGAGISTEKKDFDPYSIAKRIKENDAFIFHSAASESTYDAAKIMCEFFSVLVDKSLHPDQKNKWVGINTNDEQLGILRKIVATQYKYGLSEVPSLLMEEYDDESKVPEMLRAHWQKYERIEPSITGKPSDEVNQFDIREDLNDKREGTRPSVVVLASGKSVATELVDETKVVATKIARSRQDAVYGGGAKGLMGRFQEIFREVVAAAKNGGRIAGVSTTIVLGKETDTNELPKELDVRHKTTDMITRMLALFRANGGVFLGGGIGTAEEIAFMIVLKMAGHSLVADKPMILVNSLMNDGERLCDGYLEYFGYQKGDGASPEERRQKGRKILEEIGVHVVEADKDNFEEKFNQKFDQIFPSSAALAV